MTPLARALAERIRRDGPVTVADYMAAALGDPDHGYYTTRDPFGVDGDFTTAPEISQMFGELLGLWAAEHWRAMGAPDPVRLIELGPGRGTLMADALRAASQVAGFHAALRVDLVEVSPALRARQAAALADRIAPNRIAWRTDLADAPPGPALVLANEFFDALPVRQAVKTENGWRERRVGLNQAGAFAFVAGEAVAPPNIADADRAAPGTVAETSPAGRAVAATLGARLARHGGAALIADYGHARPGLGETLQAVRAHAYCGVFDAPGDADLTAHVDFRALADAAAEAGAAAFGPVDQGDFLNRLGIRERAAALKAKATAGQAAAVDAALARLTGADGMGRLFRVLALSTPGGPAPPGFES
jgi:NADH dehydrogenase [ubiquinone] 1 alpha subcomplex assembly factor 7